MCEVWGFTEDSCLLGYGAVSAGELWWAFRRELVPSSPGSCSPMLLEMLGAWEEGATIFRNVGNGSPMTELYIADGTDLLTNGRLWFLYGKVRTRLVYKGSKWTKKMLILLLIECGVCACVRACATQVKTQRTGFMCNCRDIILSDNSLVTSRRPTLLTKFRHAVKNVFVRWDGCLRDERQKEFQRLL